MDEQVGRARVRLSRTIEADPTSTALLLAGPTAMDLWPGLRRKGAPEEGVAVQAELHRGELSRFGAVRAEPPHRTPTAYVSRFETVGPGLPRVVGTLTLAYSGTGEGAPATAAELDVDAVGLDAAGITEPSLRALVGAFLDNLAAAAESRSDAA